MSYGDPGEWNNGNDNGYQQGGWEPESPPPQQRRQQPPAHYQQPNGNYQNGNWNSYGAPDQGRQKWSQPVELAPVEGATPTERANQALIMGDLSRLTAEEKLIHYLKVCESTGLNPATTPFAYCKLKGSGEKLYALKGATDQLRKINGVSVKDVTQSQHGGILIVKTTVTDREGRTDTDIGCVNLEGLQGEPLANAIMKAITKSKRRVTLSICGLGFLDETEVDSIPDALTLSGPSVAEVERALAVKNGQALTPPTGTVNAITTAAEQTQQQQPQQRQPLPIDVSLGNARPAQDPGPNGDGHGDAWEPPTMPHQSPPINQDPRIRDRLANPCSQAQMAILHATIGPLVAANIAPANWKEGVYAHYGVNHTNELSKTEARELIDHWVKKQKEVEAKNNAGVY